MAAPYLRSPWERLNPVAARLCPEAGASARARENQAEGLGVGGGGGRISEKKTVPERLA